METAISRKNARNAELAVKKQKIEQEIDDILEDLYKNECASDVYAKKVDQYRALEIQLQHVDSELQL